MPIEIRSATQNDLPLLAQMNKHLIEDEGSRNPMTLAQLQQRMAGWLRNLRVDLLLEGKEVVGYTIYQFRPDNYFPEQNVVYLRQFFIQRGKRNQGLGTEAIQKLIQTRFRSASRVTLEVLDSNTDGRRFYEQLGFRPYSITMSLHPSAGATNSEAQTAPHNTQSEATD